MRVAEVSFEEAVEVSLKSALCLFNHLWAVCVYMHSCEWGSWLLLWLVWVCLDWGLGDYSTRQQWSLSCLKDKCTSPVNHNMQMTVQQMSELQLLRKEHKNRKFTRLGFGLPPSPSFTTVSLLAPLSHPPVVPLSLCCSSNAILHPAFIYFLSVR